MLASCIPEDLPIENIPQAESRLVVSSAIQQNLGVVVTVTRSINALDDATRLDPDDLLAELAVSGADVQFLGNNQSITVQELFPGVYATPVSSLSPNVEYELRVNDAERRQSVSASTEFLSTVPILIVEAAAVKATTDSLAEVTVVFSDPPGEENWYMVSVQPLGDSGPLLSDEDVFAHLFTDEDQDGQLITESFIALDFDGYDIGDTILVALSNISKGYHDFLDARENDQTGVEFLYEPYNYPSNVNNGYGYFSLHTLNSRIITVQP